MARGRCKKCFKAVTTVDQVCPHCGANNPYMGFGQIAVGAAVLALLLLALVQCVSGGSNSPPQALALTQEGIRSLSPKISEVSINKHYAKEGAVLIDLQINQSPLMGSGQDWNTIAGDAHTLASRLLDKPEIERIRFFYSAPGGLQWAQIHIERDSLPGDWKALTYLQFASHAALLPQSASASTWLCEFYANYQSAAPINPKQKMRC